MSRNLVNVDAIRVAVANRNSLEKDSIKIWLKKPFIRHVSNEFTAFKKVRNVEDYVALTSDPIPQWLLEKLDTDQEFIFIDPHDPTLIEMESNCVEWLNTRIGTLDEPKFNRMTAAHVLQKYHDEHERIYALSQKGFRETTFDALEECIRSESLICYEFKSGSVEFRQELMNETVMVQHCVGQFEDRKNLKDGYGEHYASKAENGEMRIFSFRTATGKAHITMSLIIEGDDLWLDQLKGKQNQSPALGYQGVVLQALNELKIKAQDNYDLQGLGIVTHNDEFVSAVDVGGDVLMQAIYKTPNLIELIENPSDQQLWAAIQRDHKLAASRKLPVGLQVALAMIDPFVVRKIGGYNGQHRLIASGNAMLKNKNAIGHFPQLGSMRF